MNQVDLEKPTIVILLFENSLGKMFVEILTLEGYPTEVVRSAEEALSECERAQTCVVLIDNYHLSQEAQTFSKSLFSRPDLHARVKLVGINMMRCEYLVDLDAFIKMPFKVDEFIEPIARLCTELQASE